MFKILFGVAIGYAIERFFGVRIKKNTTDGNWYIYYNTRKGARDKKKLF